MISDNTHHYYASGAYDWRVNSDLAVLIDQMKRLDNPTFAVWRVELPIDAAYKIDNYRPDVDLELLSLIGQWRKDERGVYQQVK